MRFIFILLLVVLPPCFASAAEEDFRFHILSDPVTLDSLQSTGSWNSFIHYNLYRSFFRFEGSQRVPEYAKNCHYVKPLELHCQMQVGRKYSNGQEIALSDFITPFKKAFAAESTPKVKAELVYLKNAQAILAGTKTVEDLGVQVHPSKKNTLVFYFDQIDADFLNRLTSPVFSPRPLLAIKDDVLARDYATGPYQFNKKESLKYVAMIANKNYPGGHELRPPVKALIVNNDSTAYNLYQKGELNFLRRLPQDQYSAVLKSAQAAQEVHMQPQIRMDYLGLSNALQAHPALREALALSADYAELQRILKARGRPGCFSLFNEYYSGAPLCYDFNLKRAQKLISTLPAEVLTQPIQFYYSIQGGDDIQRAAEWFQNQWKKNLKLNIQLNPSEQTELTNRLKTNPPDIYRRGVPVDALSCLSALETFQADHPENFLKITNKALTQQLSQLNNPNLTKNQVKRHCRKALEAILSENRLIPMGEMYFVSMSRPTFTGWRLNALNQLDLSGLRLVGKKSQ